jgi:hypothetical protein
MSDRTDSLLLPPIAEETIGATDARRSISTVRAGDLQPGDRIEGRVGGNDRGGGPITNIAPISSGIDAGHLLITRQWGEPVSVHPDSYVGVSVATADRVKKTGGRTRDLGLMEVDSKLLPPLKNDPAKTNWWEKVGGLPDLVTRVAKHLVSEKHKTESTAIATAISQIRKVCSTGMTFGGKVKVHPDTKAEYCKAAAEIEAKRAAAKGGTAIKASVKEMELTRADAAALALGAAERLAVLAESLGPEYLVGAVAERDFSQAARAKAKKKGAAMPDGSFPIETTGDLKNAVRAIGRASKDKRAAVWAHIRKRAKALGASNLVPSNTRMAEELSEEIIALNAIVEVFAPYEPQSDGLAEAYMIPSLSTLRSQVKANRRADNRKSKSSSSKTSTSSSTSGIKRAPKGSPNGGQFIRSGASGPVVKGIQKRLGIHTTGTFGGNTKSRIEQFQKNHGLTVDGIIGAQTATALLTNGKKKVAVGSLSTQLHRRLQRRYT